MKANVTFNQIATELVNVFNSEARSNQYYNTTGGSLREGICGWCGCMSPLSKSAFIEDFGAETVAAAENEARLRLAAKDNEYAATQHAAHVAEANANESSTAAPVPGSFVWGWFTGLKNDGMGVCGIIEDMTDPKYNDDEKDRARRELVKVERVISITADQMTAAETADEIVKTYKTADPDNYFPGGSRNDDPEYNDLFDSYKTWFTCAAALVDDTGRWILVNSEGFNYARYIGVPTDWRTMFADITTAAEKAHAERIQAERIQAEKEAAARRAAYVERCKKWSPLMTDLRPLMAAEKEAADTFGYKSKEAKTAARKLQAARRANILAMVHKAFPGLKCSLSVNHGWGSAYDLNYYDGPTSEKFEEQTDLDLFENIGYEFNGWDDSTDYTHHEHTDFSQKYFGVQFGGVKVRREQSDENRARLANIISEAVPTANEHHRMTDDEKRAAAAALGVDYIHVVRACENWYNSPRALAHCVFYHMNFDEQPTQPTTPNDPDQGTRAAADENGEAPADGLQLVEITGGVAVVGNSRTTYKNRKTIKAHGAKWNRDAQQWQATDPETVAVLRAWFGVDDEPTPDPDGTDDTAANADSDTTEAANESDTTPTKAAESTQTATDDQQTTDTAESATEATENDKKNVFGFSQFDMLKEKHPYAVLMFRVGDFYELYEQDAHTAADLLGIITTDRPDGVTVCAFPHHALGAYLPRIIRAGHRVAICDQLQQDHTVKHATPDPTPGKGSGVEDGTAEPESIRYKASETSPNHQTAEEKPAAALDYEEVTNPIKADDINTPRVLRLSDRRDIVTGCNDEQRAELVTMGGKETAEGVTFRTSKQNRAALHVWQNEQTRKQRAVLLGEGWQWATLEHHGKEGDEICTTDGTRGTVTKSSPESICIEFETADGHTYSVAGHFVRTSPRYRTSETSPKPQAAEQNTSDRLEIGTRVLCKHLGVLGTVDDYNTRDGKLTYIVRYDESQKEYDGKECHTGEYLRDGITANYDPETGRERVGNLEYYDELLAAEWWDNDTRNFDFGNVQLSVDAPEDRSRIYREKWCVIIYEGDREAVTEWVHIRTLAALLAYYYEHRTTDQNTEQPPPRGQVRRQQRPRTKKPHIIRSL